MRARLSTVALLISISSAANAGPKEEAFQVVEKWTKAFSESDVDGIVKLYATDAVRHRQQSAHHLTGGNS
jgi:ketosteroid isomerase-like protein